MELPGIKVCDSRFNNRFRLEKCNTVVQNPPPQGPIIMQVLEFFSKLQRTSYKGMGQNVLLAECANMLERYSVAFVLFLI